MSLNILSLQIADPDTRNQIKQAIEQLSPGFDGTWLLSLLDSPGNDSWEVKLTGPDGIQRVRKLSGPQEHTAQAVQRALDEASLEGR